MGQQGAWPQMAEALSVRLVGHIIIRHNIMFGVKLFLCTCLRKIATCAIHCYLLAGFVIYNIANLVLSSIDTKEA